MGEPANRLWATAQAGVTEVVVLTDEAVWLAQLPGHALAAAEEEIGAGIPPAEALGPLAKVVPLKELHEAYKDRRLAKMLLFHGPEKVPYHTEVIFADAQARDEAFEELHRRLGRGWKVEERDVRAWRTLVLLLVVELIFTFAGFMAVRQAETGTAPDPVTGRGVVGQGIAASLAGSVGSLGVLGIGLALGALLVWAVVHTKKHPPKAKMVAIIREGQQGTRY